MILIVLFAIGVLIIWGIWYHGQIEKRAEAERLEQYLREAQAALNAIDALPALPPVDAGIPLQKGEVCYWKGGCSWRELRSRTTRVSYHGPTVSIPIMKGVRYRLGSIAPTVERSQSLEQIDSGVLYITSKRLFFDGAAKNSTITYKSLVRVAVFPGGFEAEKQTGRSPYFYLEQDTHRGSAIASRALAEATRE
ncbi:MAG: hypothetical protein ACRENB_00090 [Gemmatimonadales bacterium]